MSPLLLLLGIPILVTLGYIGVCIISPMRPCLWCHGRGTVFKIGVTCPRCLGDCSQLRMGVRLLYLFRSPVD